MSDAAREHSNENTDEEYIEGLVQSQLEKLGDNPSIIDAVSVLLKQSAKAECEARKVTKKLEHGMAETFKIAQANRADISTLKNKVEHSDQVVTGLQQNHQNLEARLNQIEFYVNKTFYLACENRQRSSKGNLF